MVILANEWNAQLCSTVPLAADHLSYDTRGWHRLLWELGIPADILEASEVHPRGASYQVILLPFPLSISEKLAGDLERMISPFSHLIMSGGRKKWISPRWQPKDIP